MWIEILIHVRMSNQTRLKSELGQGSNPDRDQDQDKYYDLIYVKSWGIKIEMMIRTSIKMKTRTGVQPFLILTSGSGSG